MFYFGYIPDHGHGVLDARGKQVYTDVGPFKDYEFDSGEFMPTAHKKWDRWRHHREPQSAFRITHARGWTVAASWDRSGDKRGNSNASFFCEGTLGFAEMMARARAHFPGQVARIESAAPITEFTETP